VVFWFGLVSLSFCLLLFFLPFLFFLGWFWLHPFVLLHC